MADKYDKLLKDYFSGSLNNAIHWRKEELQARRLIDENIGGSKTKNVYVHHVETQLMRFENDEKLQDLITKRDQLNAIMDEFSKERVNVVSQLYRRKWTAEGVAVTNNISRSTVFRWKNAVKKRMREYNIFNISND